MILIGSIGLALAACSRPAAEPPSAVPGAPAMRSTVAPSPDQTAGLVCQPGLLLCTTCTGGQVCARECPLCPPAASPQPGASPTAQLSCQPPQRSCTNCDGTPLCAVQCPECPAPIAARPDALPATVALGPAAETCGGTI